MVPLETAAPIPPLSPASSLARPSEQNDLRMGCSPEHTLSTHSSPNTAMPIDKSPETEPMVKEHKVVVITDSSEQPPRKTKGEVLKEIEKRARPSSKYLRPPFVSVDGRARIVEEPTSIFTLVAGPHTPCGL